MIESTTKSNVESSVLSAGSPNVAIVALPLVRRAIATALLRDEIVQQSVGDITLHPHQRSAVARVQRTLIKVGGALLGDDVGLGKTYVALALAKSYEAVAVVAPATLAAMWREAMHTAHIGADFLSIEALGRGGAPDRRYDLLIVDEAHHFRNSCTRRYSALARMCMTARVVLLSATPIHNSRDDLASIIALFLGSRAYAMSDAELAAMIVRRDATAVVVRNSVPSVVHAAPRIVLTNDSMLDRILDLPAPVPPRDGSVAARLVLHGLVRQWASSNAALVAALRRRIARSHALLASLDAGRYPTSAELSAWVYTGDAVQLAFAELLSPAALPATDLGAALRSHLSGLTRLLAFARHFDDGPLAGYLREIRARHPRERIIAFTSYAETAESLYRVLRNDGEVAVLTARGAMIASGPVNRAEVLEQFGVSHADEAVVPDRERITLLIATDLLSEGVNLQRASVVVHLDLPWTVARIEQRIGRLARLGSPHERIVSYSIHPPTRAEGYLHELDILARKAALTDGTLGAAAHSTVLEPTPNRAAVASRERGRLIVEAWRDEPVSEPPDETRILIATAIARRAGAVGVWSIDGEMKLLALDAAHRVSDGPRDVETALELATIARDDRRPIEPSAIDAIMEAVRRWYERRLAWRAIGATADDSFVGSGNLAPRRHDARRSLARIADSAVANSGFARRTGSTELATRLRSAATGPLPLAVEWSLESLADSGDDAAAYAMLDLVERARPAPDRVHEPGIRCIAAIVLQRDPANAP